VWDIETGEARRFELPVPAGSASAGKARSVSSLSFIGDSVLLTGDSAGIRRWDVETGHSELIVKSEVNAVLELAASTDGQTVLMFDDPWGQTGQCYPVQRVRPSDGTVRAMPELGDCVRSMALAPSGTVVVTGDADGLVRLGRVDGGEPHLLFGHEGVVGRVAISPDNAWVASAGEDGTLRIWPMPDLDRPPIHSLPHDELRTTLRSLTNIRVVRDPESPRGWRVALDPFPGWKETPTWFTPAPEWRAHVGRGGAP
jgi:WD40 repeat protein